MVLCIADIRSSPIDLLARMQSKPPGLEAQDERDAQATASGSSSGPLAISQHENSIRQMVANEIEAERIRRFDAKRGPRSQAGVKGVGAGRSAALMQAYAEMSSPSAKKVGAASPAEGMGEDSRRASRGGRLAAAKKDFFGRPIVERSTAQSRPSGAEAVDAGLARIALAATEGGKIWYRYNEGFTNAIKRPLKFKDLFPPPASHPQANT